MSKGDFIHLPKPGFWIFGEPKMKNIPNTSSLFAVLEKDYKGVLSVKDFDQLCFVHGTKKDLLEGKRCVIRDLVQCPNENGYWSHTKEKVCFHLEEGGVLLYIGYTVNGNAIVVYKNKKQ